MGDQGSDEADRVAMDGLLRGFQVSCLLRAVAEIGLADAIPLKEKASVLDLAQKCNVLPQPLLRMLRALAAFEIFRITKGEMVEHTSRSYLLRTDVPNGMHHGALFWTGPGSWGAWGKLEAALQGQIPHNAAWGTDRFSYLRAHPKELALFDAMMANFPDNRHTAIAAGYDFRPFQIIADIGGGNGATLRHILHKVEAAKGILFDQEEVVRKLTFEETLEGRISINAGSFFDGVPQGADAYLLVRVLHDWPEEDCLRILRSVRAAMMPKAILLIGEHLLEEDPVRGRPADYLTDIQMMAMFGSARQRNCEELENLLQDSGFRLLRRVQTGSAVTILEASCV